MKLTPAAANLLIEAIDRADTAKRIANLADMRMAFLADPKQFDKFLAILKR